MSKIKKFFRSLGPGFITGASDDDPSGIATYSMTGSMFGFAQLWLAVFCIPLMVAVQEMCGRIGIVTGKGLTSVIKNNYSKKILVASTLLLLIANIINIGADLGAMASTIQFFIPLPSWIIIIFVSSVIIILEIFLSYRVYVKYLKYLSFALLAYVLAVFSIKIDWAAVFYYTFIPQISFTKDSVANIVAFLGTSISPYLFFWQASEEVEEEVLHHKLRRMGSGVPHVSSRDLVNLRRDTAIGMGFSQIIAWFIVVTTGATLFKSGINEINSVSDAAFSLRPLAGDFAYVLFALGIIATGFLVVPVLSGSVSYAVSELFSWKEGLYLPFKKAHGFYFVIIISTFLGALINFIGINPFQALYLSAIVNGLLSPPLLLMIILISNNKKILGNKTNNLPSNIFGILTFVVMSASAVALLYLLMLN